MPLSIFLFCFSFILLLLSSSLFAGIHEVSFVSHLFKLVMSYKFVLLNFNSCHVDLLSLTNIFDGHL